MAYETDRRGNQMMPQNGISAPANASTAAAQQREASSLQVKMYLSKQYPRDIVAVRDAIRNDCADPRLAEQALYSYSRGGTDISGPSIRLAEAVARRYGNILTGVRELTQAGGASEMEAFAWDLETNFEDTKIFQVPHVRGTRNGNIALTDPRDIYELGANMAARRKRACIMAVIPMDIFDEAVEQCERTLRTNVDTSPEYIKRVVEGFAKWGVTQTMIEKKIQCRVEAIKPAQMVTLKKIANSIKDGMSAPGDWFEMQPAVGPETSAPPSTSRTEALKENLKRPASKDPFGEGSDTDPGLNETIERNRAAVAEAEKRDEEKQEGEDGEGGADLFGSGAASGAGAQTGEAPEAIRADITALLKDAFPTVADGSAWMRQEYGVRNAGEAADAQLAEIRTGLRERLGR